MTGCPDALACAVACWLGELSQHPMCPHSVHLLRCSHQPPASRHSTQPVPLGGTSGSKALVIFGPPATFPVTVGEKPMAVMRDVGRWALDTAARSATRLPPCPQESPAGAISASGSLPYPSGSAVG